MRLRQQISGQDGEQKQQRKTAQCARHRASSDDAARAKRRFILLAKSERTNFHSLKMVLFSAEISPGWPSQRKIASGQRRGKLHTGMLLYR
jgi:hypothetical protein